MAKEEIEMCPIACGLQLNAKNMVLLPAACGIACDVCQLKERCGGCVSGTDPDAPRVLERIRKGMGNPCPVLECAIERKVEYCLGCEEFPCKVHYQHQVPYSKKALDLFKKFRTESSRV